ncbi:MAG: hypothetical protein HXM82_01275 [Neisseria sp.]|nr:hypothetical protein [Neisseria sp.]
MKNSCRDLKVDSRLRGNNGSQAEIYAATCACPLSRLAGEGWGEGGSMGGCTSLILPKAGKPPPS